MPFTPFHFGPALLAGLLCFRWLDFPTVLAATVVVDLRATLVLFGALDGPLHGPLHTFAGSAALAVLLIGVMWTARPWLDPVLEFTHLSQPVRPSAMAAAALAGVWSHVALDAVLYADLSPFAPLSTANPFLGLTGILTVSLGCAVAGLLGLTLYGLHLGGVARVTPPDSGLP